MLDATISNSIDSKSLHTFTETSLAKRIITTSVLLVLVSTVIPYQFVFVVLCIVQVATCIRALSLACEIVSIGSSQMNFLFLADQSFSALARA